MDSVKWHIEDSFKKQHWRRRQYKSLLVERRYSAFSYLKAQKHLFHFFALSTQFDTNKLSEVKDGSTIHVDYALESISCLKITSCLFYNKLIHS